jgi:hypothetical protein
MKKSLRIALMVVVLAAMTPVLQAAPSNPWPVPVPQTYARAISAPSNPWPVPVPQSFSAFISMLLSFFGR